MIKPMVAIDQMPWNELDVDGSLTCRVKDPYFRQVEWMLRSQIYKWEHLPADMVLQPYILLPRAVSDTGYGLEKKEKICSTDAKNDVVAHMYEDQLQDYDDLEKIKTPILTVDREKEKWVLDTANEVFAGIAPVRFTGITMHLGIWDYITQRRGVENCYIDMLDRPEFLHAIMEKMTTAMAGLLDQINREGVYDVNSHICHCSYTYLDSLPSSAANPARPITQDGWAFGLAQLFSSVSPELTEEFEIPYMQRLFPYFGAIYYGCCERLDDRLDIIAKMPNIRKISCSPWSDRDHFAQVLPKQYIMSNKPNPALLAADSFNEGAIREDLRHTIHAAQQNGV